MRSALVRAAQFQHPRGPEPLHHQRLHGERDDARRKTPIVVVNSSLLGGYRPNEVQTVFAHEWLRTLGALLLHDRVATAGTDHGRRAPEDPPAALPVRGYVPRPPRVGVGAAELSSDRVAALVMGDPLDRCAVLMRIAGGAFPGMSLDAFLKQATEYHEEEDLFSRHARFWVELTLTHPIAVRRVRSSAGANRRLRPHPRRRLSLARPSARSL